MDVKPNFPLAKGLLALLLLLPVLTASCPAQAAGAPATLSPETQWMLNCQGCHRADGRGSGSAVPTLHGMVSRFLSVPGGREYLIRVPGVATSPLSNASLAVLVNWMFGKFDPDHVPAEFVPYSEQEIASLRSMGAYNSEAAEVRSALLRALASGPADR